MSVIPPPVCSQLDCFQTAPHRHHVGLAALRLFPSEQGRRTGLDGGADAHKHLTDHAPGWLLDALGDSLLACQGGDFTSEMVRHRAEQSEAVKGWLGVKGRENCFPGWWRSRIKLHKLVRVDRAPAIAQRSSRRGATLPWWRWPVEGRQEP